MPLLDLIQTPDCFAMIVDFLEPHELQALRCVSKGLKKIITGKIRWNAIEKARDKYSRAVRMPDGAIRIYTELGMRKFDMYTIPDSFYSNPDYGVKTPMYTLKQDGQADQIGHMTCVGNGFVQYYGEGPDERFTEAIRNDIFIKGNEAILSSGEIKIEDIKLKREYIINLGYYDTPGKSTTIKMYMNLPYWDNVFVSYKFEVFWTEAWHDALEDKQ
jgi:hypothetical protein